MTAHRQLHDRRVLRIVDASPQVERLLAMSVLNDASRGT